MKIIKMISNGLFNVIKQKKASIKIKNNIKKMLKIVKNLRTKKEKNKPKKIKKEINMSTIYFQKV